MSNTILLEPIPNESGWTVYRIPVNEFPIAAEIRPLLLSLYLALDAPLASRYPERGVFLQYNQLSLGRSAYLLAERGKDWMPEVGLAYEPHKPPPTLWTRDEFMSLGIGEMPRPMMHQLFRITTGDGAAEAAIREMTGIGPLLITRGSAPVADTLQGGTTLFQPLIEEMSLKHFDWYLPLFNLATYGAAGDKMRQWSCGLAFYWRENPEDKGVVIGSSETLDPVLAAIGAERRAEGGWTWSPTAA